MVTLHGNTVVGIHGKALFYIFPVKHFSSVVSWFHISQIGHVMGI